MYITLLLIHLNIYYDQYYHITVIYGHVDHQHNREFGLISSCDSVLSWKLNAYLSRLTLHIKEKSFHDLSTPSHGQVKSFTDLSSPATALLDLSNLRPSAAGEEREAHPEKHARVRRKK
jgi:hypothetical protein